ncbi:aldehyde dehydrogenase family protein [Streptomyces fuscichromogenes]|uniref:Aldehyde dehydrogenase domain-containing protein n=1 Tax=Streptomyces fuscichromogenes TaxID=1324013 RepID=A0A918CV91_9ACTN|nr:aldehyde dehydrogenase family protein [Streptomyces fuscichromogenes]GGN33951.1 hypothetical protein GCM10011578_074220 [Streptomyces fuscichromogenes]
MKPYTWDGRAAALAHGSEFGLGTAARTADRDRAVSVAGRVGDGTIGVNACGHDSDSPFGGRGASDLDRALGPED